MNVKGSIKNMTTRFQGKFKRDGFDFGDTRERILHYAKYHTGERFILTPIIPESREQRGFFEGAVIPMWVYLDGYDHRDSVKQLQYHEYAKEEFNPEMIIISGRQVKKGASTKGKLNGENGVINKVIDFLEEQYGIDRIEVLDPKKYKHWKDAIFPYEGADNYIDYLVETKKLTKKMRGI